MVWFGQFQLFLHWHIQFIMTPKSRSNEVCRYIWIHDVLTIPLKQKKKTKKGTNKKIIENIPPGFFHRYSSKLLQFTILFSCRIFLVGVIYFSTPFVNCIGRMEWSGVNFSWMGQVKRKRKKGSRAVCVHFYALFSELWFLFIIDFGQKDCFFNISRALFLSLLIFE